jgi:hypothetical protein
MLDHDRDFEPVRADEDDEREGPPTRWYWIRLAMWIALALFTLALPILFVRG